MNQELRTRQQRFEHFDKLLHDDKVALSPGEALSHLYHLMKFEWYVLRRRKAIQVLKKEKKWLEDADKVYKLRRQLHDL